MVRCKLAFASANDELKKVNEHRARVKLISAKPAADQTQQDKEYAASIRDRNLDREAQDALKAATKSADELKAANDNVTSLVHQWQIHQNRQAKRAKEYQDNQCLLGLEQFCTERPITDVRKL